VRVSFKQILKAVTVSCATSSVLFLSIVASGATIEFPEEELATETVYPVFDNPEAVKRRRVVTEKRVELGLLAGYSVNEPFFQPLAFGGNALYHFTEEHGVEVFGTLLSSELSSNAESIKASSAAQDYAVAPAIQYIAGLLYNWKPFYGKVSLTKSTILNLSTHFSVGPALISFEDESKYGLAFGLGQRFYFSPKVGLRLDLRGLMFSGPNLASRSHDPTVTGGRKYKVSDYEQSSQFSILFSVGVLFLL